MSEAFNGRAGLILLEAQVSGPMGTVGATLVLDTGATNTSINETVLRSVGYDPDAATDFVELTTGSAVRRVPRLMINRLGALGRHAVGQRVLAHRLPPGAGVDGLLGLDFFRA